MKQIAVITPVPDVINTLIENSMLRKSIENEAVKFHVVNLRDYGKGSYRQVDDAPFGGGGGMVMMAEPLSKAIDDTISIIGYSEDIRIVYPSAQGERWGQGSAEYLSSKDKIIVICGHYKGIDERVIEKYVTDEFSIGDFVMTSGEIPAMVMLDSAIRLVPGTLNNIDSALTDTFTFGLLDYPHYTQPRILDGMEVPSVLLSGHHKNIENWRQEKREIRTKEKRSDMWEKYNKIKGLENNNE